MVALREAVQQALPLSESDAEVLMFVHRVGDRTTALVAESSVPAASVETLASTVARILPPVPRDTTSPAAEERSEIRREGPYRHFRLLISATGSDLLELEAQQPATCRPTLVNRDEMVDVLSRAARSVPNRGSVVMWMFVDSTGAVTRVQVSRGSGDEVIDALGMTVGYSARFTPASIDGYTVPVWVEFPIDVQ